MPFRIYKVQYAYANDISSPSVHREDEHAESEVAYLLGQWLMKNVDSYWRVLQSRGQHPEFVEAAKVLVPQVHEKLAQGDVWGAYYLWHDFYDLFENEFNMPLYVAIGTVIVDSPIVAKRRPLMRRGNVPPMVEYQKKGGKAIMAWREDHEQMAALEDMMNAAGREAERLGLKITQGDFQKALQEVSERISTEFSQERPTPELMREFYARVKDGIMKQLFGTSMGFSLGAFRSWLVQYRDFGGVMHPSRHTSEERAKIDAKRHLETLIHHLATHSFSEGVVGRNHEYVRRANDLINQVGRLLAQGKVWTAYQVYKSFESEWESGIGYFPLSMSIGSMRVVPDPEPEAS